MSILRYRKVRGRNASKYTEEMEDADLLKDGLEAHGHRLSQQPSVIKHGIMREYQMQGLNWLIHLYDNGINGILADEMVSSSHHWLPLVEFVPDKSMSLGSQQDCPGWLHVPAQSRVVDPKAGLCCCWMSGAAGIESWHVQHGCTLLFLSSENHKGNS